MISETYLVYYILLSVYSAVLAIKQSGLAEVGLEAP